MIVRNVIRRRRWRWKEKSRYCLKDAGWVIGMVVVMNQKDQKMK